MIGFSALGQAALGELLEPAEAAESITVKVFTANVGLTGNGYGLAFADILTGGVIDAEDPPAVEVALLDEDGNELLDESGAVLYEDVAAVSPSDPVVHPDIAYAYAASSQFSGGGYAVAFADTLTGTGYANTANTGLSGTGYALALGDTLTTQES